MENFAEYMLSAETLVEKMEIAYYLSKNQNLLFDKTVVFKTELARLFLNYMEINVNKNLVLTACLLCNCKKIENPQELEKVKSYAKKGAEYLKTLGFNDKICKVCEEVNRYSKSSPREKESDILELVDQYGGMLLARTDRMGFKSDEALVLLEHRNLKNKYNRYLESFITFITEINEIQLGDDLKIPTIEALIKTYNMSGNVKSFIRNLVYKFEPSIDKEIEKVRNTIKANMLKEPKDPNRSLFSAETTKKILEKITKENNEVLKDEE